MAVDVRLVNKGRGEPLGGLTQQGKISVLLGREHAVELAEHGWTKAGTDALEASLGALSSSTSVQADAEGAALAATKKERTAVLSAKKFIRLLRHALPTVLRTTKVPDIDRRSFRAGTTLGLSTPVISRYLDEIRGVVVKLDADLKPYFKGALASAELDRVKKDLDGADAAQELAVAKLPAGTERVYALKGSVLEMIEDMNRVAKIAFDDQPAVRALFNKDLLKRARGTRKAVVVDPPPPVVVPVPHAVNGVSVPPAG